MTPQERCSDVSWLYKATVGKTRVGDDGGFWKLWWGHEHDAVLVGRVLYSLRRQNKVA